MGIFIDVKTIKNVLGTIDFSSKVVKIYYLPNPKFIIYQIRVF